MRNEDGVYVGRRDCVNYVGVESIGEKSCCGNKKYSVAYIKCSHRGIMDAEVECHHICKNFVEDFEKGRRWN